MYVPQAFRFDDREELLAHATAHPFATLVTHGEDGLAVSHVPLLVDASRNVLRGHLARENAQLSHITAGARAIAIFHGPHAYVSPSVYTEHPSVPTWNYVVVHAEGPVTLVGDRALRAILDDTVARFDTSDWRLDEGEEFLGRMMGAIAGFEIAIERLEGKWKLSQNRTPEERERVVRWLEHGDDESRALAALMRHHLKLTSSE